MKAIDSVIPTIKAPFAFQDAFRDYGFYETGITSQMVIPSASGGTRFNRHMMNGIGYLATLGTFLGQCGYPYAEHDLEKAATFGGYPKGAIVYVVDEDSGMLVEYQSKVDDNIYPLPEQSNGFPQEDENWRPLYESLYRYGVPSFDEKIAETEVTVSPDMADNGYFSVDHTIQDNSWVVISRTIDNWNNIPKNFGDINAVNLVFGAPVISVTVENPPNGEIVMDSLPVSAGKEVHTSFPVGILPEYSVGYNPIVRVRGYAYNFRVYGNITVNITSYRLQTKV